MLVMILPSNVSMGHLAKRSENGLAHSAMSHRQGPCFGNAHILSALTEPASARRADDLTHAPVKADMAFMPDGYGEIKRAKMATKFFFPGDYLAKHHI